MNTYTCVVVGDWHQCCTHHHGSHSGGAGHYILCLQLPWSLWWEPEPGDLYFKVGCWCRGLYYCYCCIYITFTYYWPFAGLVAWWWFSQVRTGGFAATCLSFERLLPGGSPVSLNDVGGAGRPATVVLTTVRAGRLY